jgi:hypothetical protein
VRIIHHLIHDDPALNIGEISPKREIKNIKFNNEIILELTHTKKRKKKRNFFARFLYLVLSV